MGVDVETGDSLNISALSELCCSPNERDKLQSLDPAGRLSALVRNWTLKEAYTKAIGVGHQQPFHEIEASLLPTEETFVTLLENTANLPLNWIAFEPKLAPLQGYAAAVVCEKVVSPPHK